MNNGGGGARKVVSSEVIDLSAIGALQFSGQLVVDDTSSGCEAADSFTAYLIIDGNTANPINLIDPAQDTGGTGTAGRRNPFRWRIDPRHCRPAASHRGRFIHA